MSQAIQTINNWTEKELISFSRNYKVMEEQHGDYIIVKLIELAEMGDCEFNENLGGDQQAQ